MSHTDIMFIVVFAIGWCFGCLNGLMFSSGKCLYLLNIINNLNSIYESMVYDITKNGHYTRDYTDDIKEALGKNENIGCSQGN